MCCYCSGYSGYGYSPFPVYSPYQYYPSFSYAYGYPYYGLPLGYTYASAPLAPATPRGEYRVGNCLMICQ